MINSVREAYRIIVKDMLDIVFGINSEKGYFADKIIQTNKELIIKLNEINKSLSDNLNDELKQGYKTASPDYLKQYNEDNFNPDIYLHLKCVNWLNFFRVHSNKIFEINLVNNASKGNFSALIQELESQFRELSGFKGSFYDLL